MASWMFGCWSSSSWPLLLLMKVRQSPKQHRLCQETPCSNVKLRNRGPGTSLVVQWLRFWAPNAGGLGSIPGRGTRAHILQLKTLHAATKIWHSQINNFFFFKERNRGPKTQTVQSTKRTTGTSVKHDPPLIPSTDSFLEQIIGGSRCHDSCANLICM